jgi:hypothetical protein
MPSREALDLNATAYKKAARLCKVEGMRGKVEWVEGKGSAPEKAEPRVTFAVAQLHQDWFIPASFLNFPEESLALSSFR